MDDLTLEELELVGEFEAAGDGTTALVIGTPGSQSQKAVDERIQGVASDIIGSDPTLIATATAKVDQAISTRDVLTGPDMRSPRLDQESLFDAATLTAAGSVVTGLKGGQLFTAGVHPKTPVRVAAVDARKFLRGGETLPDNDKHCAQRLIQRALRWIVDHPTFGISAVYLPNGVWRLYTDIDVYGMSGIGIVGESEAGTILKPVGAVSAIKARIPSGYEGPDHVDHVYGNLTIDGSLQGGSGSMTNVKGIYIQRMLRPKFFNLTIKNVAATGLGCDFVRDGRAWNLTTHWNGRLILGDSSTGAGVGIATGLSRDESFEIWNLDSRNNRSHGIFLERAGSRLADLPGAPGGHKSFGLQLHGGVLAGNFDGYFGSGGTAARLNDVKILDNRFAGVWVDENDLTLVGDDYLVANGCLIKGNGSDATTGANRAGIRLRKGMGAKFVDCDVTENWWGVKLTDSLFGMLLTFINCRIWLNKLSGMSFTSGSGPHRVRIDGCDVFDNGTAQTGVEGEQDGISFFNRNANDVVITNTRSFDSRAAGQKTQRRGLVTASPAIPAAPSVWGGIPTIAWNDFRGNADASWVDTVSIADRSFIEKNKV